MTTSLDEEVLGLPESNKRADTRFPISPIVVSFNREQTVFFGVGLNISRSGMFFQTPASMDIGDVYNIKFTLPKTNIPVACRSEVVWRKSFASERRSSTHAGIKFVDMDPGVAEHLGLLATNTSGSPSNFI